MTESGNTTPPDQPPPGTPKRKRAPAVDPRPPGRPEHVPTEQQRLQVKMLSAMGTGLDDMALFLGISPPTLRKHYEREIEIGHIEANTKVAGSLFNQAIGKGGKPNVTAAIFWLKARAGWTDNGQGATREALTPTAPREEPLGKKQLADEVAKTAHMATDWEHLLTPGARPQ